MTLNKTKSSIYQTYNQKSLIQTTGIIVIRKKATIGYFEYFPVVDAVPYKSKIERQHILKKLLRKHHIVSIIPHIVEPLPHNNFNTLLTNVHK